MGIKVKSNVHSWAERIRYSDSLVRKNETGRRTVREQSTAGVRDAAFRGADTTATVEDFAFGPDHAGIQRDRADKRNLELERGAAHALVEHRLDGQAHTAIEKN